MKQSSLLAVLLLSVSACSLAPEGNTPTDRIPDSWTIAGEPATTRAEWADFNSTELTRLIAVAQAQNTDLAAALARVKFSGDEAARFAAQFTWPQAVQKWENLLQEVIDRYHS